METAIQIRAARPGDLGALGALKLRASLAWGDYLEQLMALPEAGRFPFSHVPFAIVAERAGAVIGFATVLPGQEPARADLEDLFVDPQIWRRGIGSRLLAASEIRAAALGARVLHVVASERARAFYEASGFRFVGTVATRFAPAPALEKMLV